MLPLTVPPSTSPPTFASPREAGAISALLRGEVARLIGPTLQPDLRRIGFLLLCTLAGAGLYGSAIGSWRGEGQMAYAAVKIPSILLLTAAGNAAANALMAPLLGVSIGFRQSMAAVLSGFAITSLVLAALSPVVWFQLWNLPSVDAGWTERGHAFYTIQLTQVLVIGFAGAVGNIRLYQLLCRLAPSPTAAIRVLLAWLGGNFLLGTQLTWIFRPYFGSHALPVEFLRDHPLQGNFFETFAYGALQTLGRH